jgi:hypothetical protein
MARKISAKSLVLDIKAGMDSTGLMRKYEISEHGLQKLINKLLDNGLIEKSDLNGKPSESGQKDDSGAGFGEDKAVPSPPDRDLGRGQDEEISIQSIFGDWYERKITLILLLIFVAPIGLYGLNKTSLFPKKTKIGIAVLVIILSLVGIASTVRLWIIGIVGIGAYALYKLLPFGKAARMAASIIAGLMVLGMIAPLIDKDSRPKKAVAVRAAEVAQPEPQPAQPKPTPVVQPVQPQPAQAQTQQKPVSRTAPDGKPISEISFSDVRHNFIETDANLTKAQMPREWASKYKGKWVRWDGFVTDVRDGWGGITVNIDMLTDSISKIDLVFSVKKDQQEKALKLKKNQRIYFVGRMESQPGSLMPMDLEDVVIE